MLRLPLHPRYSRMLVEATRYGCVPQAALCAALVSGRDLLVRLGRDDGHIATARELFEASALSDFFTLMRAYQFAKNRRFSADACRRYGIQAQTARQVELTFAQIRQIAEREGLVPPRPPEVEGAPSTEAVEVEVGTRKRELADEPLLRCLLAGFADQLCRRRDTGTLECELTEGRTGTLMRESVVQNAPLFVAASLREVSGRSAGSMTLLGLATAVKREWIEEMFPALISVRVEHLFDRTHKRVAAVRLVRFQDLLIHHEHEHEVSPEAAGRCLAEAYRKGWFELPLFNHALRQFVARVNLVCARMPELDFPPLDPPNVLACLARAFQGVSTAKAAQAIHLDEAFHQHLARERLGWLDELAPLTVVWSEERRLKLLYTDRDAEGEGEPGVELQVKLHECFGLKAHPCVCEGRVPVKLWLCAPDGKRLEATFDWPSFRGNRYPKLKRALEQKHPGVTW
jgi:ATP-dependent helicase HrpB